MGMYWQRQWKLSLTAVSNEWSILPSAQMTGWARKPIMPFQIGQTQLYAPLQAYETFWNHLLTFCPGHHGSKVSLGFSCMSLQSRGSIQKIGFTIAKKHRDGYSRVSIFYLKLSIDADDYGKYCLLIYGNWDLLILPSDDLIHPPTSMDSWCLISSSSNYAAHKTEEETKQGSDP